jgi:hypothetical protein
MVTLEEMSMISLRLPEQLERQLEFVSLTTGTSKNAIVHQALAKFLLQDELGRIPLSSDLEVEQRNTAREEKLKRYNETLKSHRTQVTKVIGWANERQIWTKNLSEVSGKVTPGSYGRNIVVGFNGSLQDESIFVISKNLPDYSYSGANSYHYDITQFDDWEKYMREVRIV